MFHYSTGQTLPNLKNGEKRRETKNSSANNFRPPLVKGARGDLKSQSWENPPKSPEAVKKFRRKGD
jgi:hypothetical protein